MSSTALLVLFEKAMRDQDSDPDATLPLPGRVMELLQKREEEERRNGTDGTDETDETDG